MRLLQVQLSSSQLPAPVSSSPKRSSPSAVPLGSPRELFQVKSQVQFQGLSLAARQKRLAPKGPPRCRVQGESGPLGRRVGRIGPSVLVEGRSTGGGAIMEISPRRGSVYACGAAASSHCLAGRAVSRPLARPLRQSFGRAASWRAGSTARQLARPLACRFPAWLARQFAGSSTAWAQIFIPIWAHLAWQRRGGGLVVARWWRPTNWQTLRLWLARQLATLPLCEPAGRPIGRVWPPLACHW